MLCWIIDVCIINWLFSLTEYFSIDWLFFLKEYFQRSWFIKLYCLWFLQRGAGDRRRVYLWHSHRVRRVARDGWRRCSQHGDPNTVRSGAGPRRADSTRQGQTSQHQLEKPTSAQVKDKCQFFNAIYGLMWGWISSDSLWVFVASVKRDCPLKYCASLDSCES